MTYLIGYLVFILAPCVMGAILLCIDPRCRRIKLKSILFYLLVMTGLLYAALRFVGYVASSRVIWTEVLIAVWFTVAWRMAWAIWLRTVGRWGQKWVRWGRLRRLRQQAVPLSVRLIPMGRASLTALVFLPLFVTPVMTHRCKLADDQNPSSIFMVPYESIRIPTRDGLTLDGWFVPQGNAERTIVICHGAGANKGNFVWFLGPLLDRGYNVLFFDFRAHGSSEGRITTYGIHESADVQAAVDWLKHERPRGSRVIVGLGSSQGSMALAGAAAVDSRIDAVILDSPFTSPRKLAMSKARMAPIIGPLVVDWMLLLMSAQTGANFFTASAEDAVRKMGPKPLMVIHGSDDFLMPPEQSQRLYDAASGPKAIWFGPGPHSNIVTTDPAGYTQRVFAFLDGALGPAPISKPVRRSKSVMPNSSPTTAVE